MNNNLSWLKSMQNGSIGEMRTKAFLIDRFWILERSVDIHGADFIIQRRIYDKNILDMEAPRFGVVQSKFSQDERTYHYLDENYIYDNERELRKEFFLIINTGDENNHEMFLLSTEDIVNNFELDIEKNKFVIPSKKVSLLSYKIENRKGSLDIIEKSIERAEFYKNRSFVFVNLPSIKKPLDSILPEYKIDIENKFDSIPSFFRKQKDKAYSAILDIEEAHMYLKRYIESIDPIEASCIAEEVDHKFEQKIRLPSIFDYELYYTSKRHKEIIDSLRQDDILENYILLRKKISKEIENFLIDYPINKISRNSVYEIDINYNPVSLNFGSIKNLIKTIEEKDEYSEFSQFIHAVEGNIIFSWKIGISFNVNDYLKMNNCCLVDIMEKIYELKYYEDYEIIDE